MEFEKRKAATLASLNSPEPDKSPKGTVDAPIFDLLKTLNSHPSYFTTSSCSGRISILSQPIATAAATATKQKAKGGSWFFISHDPADPESLLNLLFPSNSSISSSSTQLSDLVFRFEPFIVAVECKDVESAQSLVSLAISSGFRESGITSVNKRVIIAIRCSIRLEVPLGDTNRLMASPEYVRYLIDIANKKMEANRQRTDNFLRALLNSGFGGSEESTNGEIGGGKGLKNGEANDLEFQFNSTNNGHNEVRNSEGIGADTGSSGILDISLSVVQMVTNGEPVEKLFLWGHSACTLDHLNCKKILIFGGFGGIGRHSRRNDSLLLDPIRGKLEVINVQGTPSPRLSHTSSLVGGLMYVIGGRADPENILKDVWVLNMTKYEWKLLECIGSEFPPRHRHASAVVGSKIYVFGGIHDNAVSSSLHVLDTDSLVWNEVCIQGDWPCPRHSHTLVAYGSKLFMFGGHDGVKPLGDLYSFDVQTCLWKKEKMEGRTPYARFSHSMFIYNNYLGIIGGCPVRQHYQELSLFDLRFHSWKHVRLSSFDENLFVRCTCSVVDDDLVMIGGGSSCYAFGTKFSEPMKIDLHPIMTLDDSFMFTGIGEKHIMYLDEGVANNKNFPSQFSENGNKQSSNGSPGLNLDFEEPCLDDEHKMDGFHKILKLERKFAKLGKDILKKFGWLDIGRKVYSEEDGRHICFPVTEKFSVAFSNKHSQLGTALEKMDGFSEVIDGFHSLKQFQREVALINDISCPTALSLLMACGATKHSVQVVKVRKIMKSPLSIMKEAVASLVNHQGLTEELLDQIPTRWDRIGDILVLPVASFGDPMWDSIGKDLWPTVAESLGTRRLARQGRVASTGTRDSTLEMLVGDNGWVDHRENGIVYSFDVTKCMFSWGNLSEKLRMARLDCREEVVVDLFAGIGYFVLPFLVGARAKLVYAYEWNPYAVEALQRNLLANNVADHCIVAEGDNRVLAPKGVADRVCLGLLPTSEGSWVTAVRALRSEGGILHVHGNVKDSEEGAWTEHVSRSLYEIANSEGRDWEVSVEHVERVKWYAPHIRHLVADVRCKQIKNIISEEITN